MRKYLYHVIAYLTTKRAGVAHASNTGSVTNFTTIAKGVIYPRHFELARTKQ